MESNDTIYCHKTKPNHLYVVGKTCVIYVLPGKVRYHFTIPDRERYIEEVDRLGVRDRSNRLVLAVLYGTTVEEVLGADQC